jgi:hypothetical protein
MGPDDHMARVAVYPLPQDLKALLAGFRLVPEPNPETDPFQLIDDAAHTVVILGRIAYVNVKSFQRKVYFWILLRELRDFFIGGQILMALCQKWSGSICHCFKERPQFSVDQFNFLWVWNDGIGE